MNFIRFWFPVIIYSGIIFYVSSVPSLEIPFRAEGIDKVFHVLEYIPLGFLVSRAFYSVEADFYKNAFVYLSIIFCCLYGICHVIDI